MSSETIKMTYVRLPPGDLRDRVTRAELRGAEPWRAAHGHEPEGPRYVYCWKPLADGSGLCGLRRDHAKDCERNA